MGILENSELLPPQQVGFIIFYVTPGPEFLRYFGFQKPPSNFSMVSRTKSNTLSE